ncbi:MAG: hypothetical protein HOP11_02095 [Saprospiraceae bacterium]|nr:hypothetical protein [Saprospiraceae bacterium]
MRRIIISALIFSSMIGYLEWGNGAMRRFLFQIEAEILNKLFQDPVSVLHPFIVLPLFGQILLTYSLFRYNRKIVIIGIIGVGILFLLLLFIGIISKNIPGIISTLPYISLSVYYLLKVK